MEKEEIINSMLDYLEERFVELYNEIEDNIEGCIGEDEKNEYTRDNLGLNADLDCVKELGEYMGFLKGLKNENIR